MKKTTITLLSIALAGVVSFGGLIIPNISWHKKLTIRVANWQEYIDEDIIGEFEEWYAQTFDEKVKIEYVDVEDNETLYNQIQMGAAYDIACPSEYMIMKLYNEGKLQKLPDSFFDQENEYNYYINNVSGYIDDTLSSNSISKTVNNDYTWKDYCAGYMWGITGFAYNPSAGVNEEDVKDWNVFVNPKYNNRITAKNNVRDTYFAGLAMYYKEDLAALEKKYFESEQTEEDKKSYQKALRDKMNDASEKTMNNVKSVLQKLKSNVKGLETDEGKDMILAGEIDINYQWSGEAAYIIDIEDDKDIHFVVPDLVSNLWFDGWVLMKGVEGKKRDAALAFINYLSIPTNAVRNMDFIGYTSAIGGQEVFDYIYEQFDVRYVPPEDEAEPEEEVAPQSETVTVVPYDLNYFFNHNYKTQGSDEKYVLQTDVRNTSKKLYAQFPDEKTLLRCVTMNFFDNDENKRANAMWNALKA